MDMSKHLSAALLVLIVGACASEKESGGAKSASSQQQSTGSDSTAAVGGLQLTQPDLGNSSSAPIDHIRIDLYFAGNQEKPAYSQTVEYKPGDKISFAKVFAGHYRIHVAVLGSSNSLMEGDGSADVGNGQTARADVQLKRVDSGSGRIDVVIHGPDDSKTACDFIPVLVPMACMVGQFQCSVSHPVNDSALSVCGIAAAKRNLLITLCANKTPFSQADFDAISCLQIPDKQPIQSPAPK